jgi:hypothetical protein
MKRVSRSAQLAGLILCGVVLAACGSASSPSASGGTASATTPVATSASASAGAPASPTPDATVASWASPNPNATVKTYKVKLSVTAGGSIATISYSATSAGRSMAACTASATDAAGNWTCTADLLKLGVVPGKVSFSFDATDASGAVTKAPAGTRTVTYAVPPPAPSGAKYKLVKETVTGPYSKLIEYRATWVEPTGYATKFRVYGLIPCLRSSKANNEKPCVVSGTTIPSGAVKVIASLDGTKRSTVISWSEEGELAGPGPYAAYLVRASNQYGSSTYTILWSATVCWECVY